MARPSEGLAEGLDVGEILQSSGGALVRDQGSAPEKGDGLATDFVFHALFPGSGEVVNPADPCEYVDPIRRHSQLDDVSGTDEVGRRDAQVLEWRTEANERIPDPDRVPVKKKSPPFE